MLVVIPLGIPDFVVSFGWRAIFPSFGGFWAAVLVMSVAVYPLVYLPVAASLRNADPAQEEVARSLGLGRMTDVLAGDGRPGPTGHSRWSRSGGPRGAGRVRGLRDPRFPYAHHRDLHRVHGRLQRSRLPAPSR